MQGPLLGNIALHSSMFYRDVSNGPVKLFKSKANQVVREGGRNKIDKQFRVTVYQDL